MTHGPDNAARAMRERTQHNPMQEFARELWIDRARAIRHAFICGLCAGVIVGAIVAAWALKP